MYNPADGYPRVVVELAYADVDSAIDWLTRVFGFQELLRQSVAGAVHHADLDTGGGVVMLTRAGGRFTSPAVDGHSCKQVIVWVDDVDDHIARSQAAGANILQPLTDKPWGLRQYLVRDVESHVWEFTQYVRDVPPHEWGAVVR